MSTTSQKAPMAGGHLRRVGASLERARRLVSGPDTSRDPALVAQVSAAAAAAFFAAHPAGAGAPVAVVIAALNEEEALGDVVTAVPARLAGLATETIVVDDGSTDDTVGVGRRAGALVCSLGTNLGHGNAFRVGYGLAAGRGARYVATADGDGQFDPRELDPFIAALEAGRADLVNGSRRLGRTYSSGMARNAGVVVFGALISVLLRRRVTDPANGLRAMRVEVPTTVGLRQPQYQTAELLIRAVSHGFTLLELPATMHPRAAGQSKKGGNLLYGARFARVVLGTWWATRPQRRGRA